MPASIRMPPINPEVALPKVSVLLPLVKRIAQVRVTPSPESPPAIVPLLVIERLAPTMPMPPAPACRRHRRRCR